MDWPLIETPVWNPLGLLRELHDGITNVCQQLQKTVMTVLWLQVFMVSSRVSINWVNPD